MIKVLIIDDSALVRQVLAEILGGAPDIEVVGTAADPYIARDKIKQLRPDVLTLDVEMPRMDGLTFLENLMRLHPLPVVMVSSLTEKGAEITLQALEFGAFDFVAKPKIGVADGLESATEELLDKVRAAAGSTPVARVARPPVAPKLTAEAVIPARSRPRTFSTTEKIIAVGASTGGTEAIRALVERLPPDAPAVVVTQHIPPAFSAPFAARVNRASAMAVCEAADGQQIVPGHVYIAPGDRHLLVVRSGARYLCSLSDGPPVSRHKPSVDVLFRSVAQNCGPNAVGVLLTGMGADGAEGLLEMRDAGAETIAQDEASSVVWGMPGAAVKLGAAAHVAPLEQIDRLALRLAGGQRSHLKSPTDPPISEAGPA